MKNLQEDPPGIDKTDSQKSMRYILKEKSGLGLGERGPKMVTISKT